MCLRPPRQGRTDVLYLWGPSGTGKTTQIYRTLKAIEEEYNIDFYCKMGGLKKFWDGYDNQCICWIDDPVLVDAEKDSDSIQELKNVISTGDVRVEIKYGSLVFDSQLIIISSNIHPRELASSCGCENIDAVYRRFTDTCGAWYLGSKEKVRSIKFIDFLCDVISSKFKIPIRYLDLPKLDTVNYHKKLNKYDFEN